MTNENPIKQIRPAELSMTRLKLDLSLAKSNAMNPQLAAVGSSGSSLMAFPMMVESVTGSAFGCV